MGTIRWSSSRRKWEYSVRVNCDLVLWMSGLIDRYVWVRSAKISVGSPFECIGHGIGDVTFVARGELDLRSRIQSSVAVVLFLLLHCLFARQCSALSPISDPSISKK